MPPPKLPKWCRRPQGTALRRSLASCEFAEMRSFVQTILRGRPQVAPTAYFTADEVRPGMTMISARSAGTSRTPSPTRHRTTVGADIMRPRRLNRFHCQSWAIPHHTHCRAATCGPPHLAAGSRRGTGPRPTLCFGWCIVGGDDPGAPRRTGRKPPPYSGESASSPIHRRDGYHPPAQTEPISLPILGDPAPYPL